MSASGQTSRAATPGGWLANQPYLLPHYSSSAQAQRWHRRRTAGHGFRVLLLEAGGDPRKLQGGDAQDPTGNRLPDDYDVPVFHPQSTENDAIKWDFFVRHYADQARQTRDPKYVATHDGKRVDGIWYPRAGTLGGCTAHNAMIFVYRTTRTGTPLRSSRATSRGGLADGSSSSGCKTAITGASIGFLVCSASTRAATAGTAGCRRRRPFRWPRWAIAT
jgi:hypothetical protein